MSRAVALTNIPGFFPLLKNNAHHSTQWEIEPLITKFIPHSEELEMKVFDFMKKSYFLYSDKK